jgi:hypothetical protein
MADVDGPGCMVRLWSANPKGTLTFLIDDHPPWSVDFAALTSGRLASVEEPLAGVHGRGANCYLPVPFQRHLQVSASEGGAYYHVNVQLLPAGTKVEAFAPQWLQQRAALFATARAALGAAPVFAPATATATAADRELPLPRNSLVQQLRFRPEATGVADLGAALRNLVLEVRCGAATTVRVPVGDFFAGAPDWKRHQGRFLGITADGVGWCNLPMPMPEGGSVRIAQDGGAPLPFRLEVVAAPMQFASAPLLFHADWHQRKQTPTRPFTDHLVLDSAGAGRFVGCTLMVQNPVKGWWGEGDEKFRVDGEAFPSTFGTGTEDYFGYAWCSPELFSAPLHAQVQCDGPGNYGFTCVNRMQVADAVPFQRSFRFDLEVWHWVDCKIDYASVAYWYGSAGAQSGLPPLPPAAERTLDRRGPLPVFAVPGAIEGEALAVAAVTGGRHEVQDLSGFGDGKFSRDGQRWWMDGKPGDTLTLRLPVAAAGRYRLKAQFCTAADYAVVQVRLHGKPAGPPLDLYHDGVAPSGERDLGEHQLPAGDVDLVLEITGKNDKAIPRHMVGLDYVKLEKLE